jgi:putative nucleotidyltransferase with HDIG domain
MSQPPKNKSFFKDTTVVTSALQFKRSVSRRIPAFLSAPWISIAGLIAALVILFPYIPEVQTSDLPIIGEVSKETTIAPFTFDILKSPTELDRERKKAIGEVLIVLDYDNEVVKRNRQKFLSLRATIYSINTKTVTEEQKTDIYRTLRKELSENTLNTLVRRPYLLDDAIFQAERVLEKGLLSVLLVQSIQRLNELREEYNAPFQRYLIYDKEFAMFRRDSIETTVKVSNLPVKEMALDNIIQMLKIERMFDQEALNSLYELLFAYIIPNVTINGEATRDRERQASMEVLPIKGKVIKDTEILRKHQEVTPEILEKLTSLRMALTTRKQGGESLRIFLSNSGKILLLILTLFLIGGYIRIFHPGVFLNPKQLTALASIIIVQIVLIRVGLFIVPRIIDSSTELTPVSAEYLIPTAFASMLVTILFNLELSFLVSVFVAVFFGMVLGFNHALFICSLLGGLATGLSARSIRYRWDFFRAIPPIVLTYCVFIALWQMTNSNIASLTINCGLGVINGILTTFLAMMFVAIFEGVFDITTDMTLIELSDMNHPLLKRLSIEAAGTYNHSVLVANLAESAAAQIDANPLLARVAAYYHDIGKLNKPNYFVENQKAERNIHHKLSPSMSALIISSHVKDGLDLALKYKLPEVIRDAILQHHGTSAVSFFYEKALEQDPHKQVQEKDFCYPGPKPQTKENAIIMLADSVEAASRSLATSSPKLLRELVKKIIHDKFSSSQLDECNLSFQNLNDIINGFMPVLQGIFHTRIKYPSRK